MNSRKTSITAVALCLSLTMAVAMAEEKKPVEGDAQTVTGNPPADSTFAKVKPGMKFDEAATILGKPDAISAYCTGKHTIPFYFGNDKARTNQYFKGQGTVIFFTEVSTWSVGRYKHCSPKDPIEVAEVHYDPNEGGVAPKEREEAKKDPAQAEK